LQSFLPKPSKKGFPLLSGLKNEQMNLILETDRLILREFQLSDAEAFFAMDSNPKVHQYLWNKPVQKIEETIEIMVLADLQ
jgi:ribosomal-protein-alanine N-acetyltransferase